MSLDYVQEKLGYNFENLHILSSALVAAERDEERGEHLDGNRGLSTFGVCAMQMVATRSTLLKPNGTKRAVNTTEHWSRSKRGRASACISLGLDDYIIQSVRQSHLQPSPTVLSYTLSAIIGAVWFDLERHESGLDMMNRISEILTRIDMLIENKGPEAYSTAYERSVSMRDSEDTQDNSFREDQSSSAWHQCTSRLEVPFLQKSSQGQREALQNNGSVASGADFESIHPSVVLDPSNRFQGSMQSMDTMRFDSAAAENNNNNTPLLELEGMIEDTYEVYQITSYTVAGTHQASSDTTNTPETDVTLGSRGRSQKHRRDTNKISLHERLVREELAKLRSPPTQLHKSLTNLLDHDGIDSLSSHNFQASQLRLLYFTIGSCQSLREFKEALHVARQSPSYIFHPSGHDLSCAERFQKICHLNETERLCILLRRFHIVKLFEEELEVLYPSDMMIIETPSSFGKKKAAEMGNPAVRRKAALIDAVLSKINPELQKGTSEHTKCRTQLKQMRRQAELLGLLTDTYGSGILALLPSKPTYSEFSSLENTLFSIPEDTFRLFSELIHVSQGPILQQLSKAVEPALTALVNGELISSDPFPIEYMEPEVFDELPKGSPEIIKQLSEPTFRHQQ